MQIETVDILEVDEITIDQDNQILPNLTKYCEINDQSRFSYCGIQGKAFIKLIEKLTMKS